jgi:hypothetical protein
MDKALQQAIDWMEGHVTDSCGGPQLDTIRAHIAALSAERDLLRNACEREQLNYQIKLNALTTRCETAEADFAQAIKSVRDQYPLDLFSDAYHGARMARLTCDNIAKEYAAIAATR